MLLPTPVMESIRECWLTAHCTNIPLPSRLSLRSVAACAQASSARVPAHEPANKANVDKSSSTQLLLGTGLGFRRIGQDTEHHGSKERTSLVEGKARALNA